MWERSRLGSCGSPFSVALLFPICPAPQVLLAYPLKATGL